MSSTTGRDGRRGSSVSTSPRPPAQAVRALIRTGDLPAIQVGARKLWRIEDQALEDYIQRQLASTRAMVAAGWNEDGAP